MFRSEVKQTALRLSGAHLVPRGEIPVLRPHQIAREVRAVNQDLCDLGSDDLGLLEPLKGGGDSTTPCRPS